MVKPTISGKSTISGNAEQREELLDAVSGWTTAWAFQGVSATSQISSSDLLQLGLPSPEASLRFCIAGFVCAPTHNTGPSMGRLPNCRLGSLATLFPFVSCVQSRRIACGRVLRGPQRCVMKQRQECIVIFHVNFCLTSCWVFLQADT